MTGDILGLSGRSRRGEPDVPGPGRTPARRRRAAAPPFRRRRTGAASPRASPRETAPARRDSSRLLSGLSAGGSAEAFVGDARRRQATVALISVVAHILVLALMIGGAARLPAPPERVAAEAAQPEPLLYAFEAPPDVGTPVPEPELFTPPPAPDAPAAPEEPPPAGAIVIPKAAIAAPSTGFQNDLPFSEGNTEEFFTDTEAGEDPDGAEESDQRTAPPTADANARAERELEALDRLLAADDAADPADDAGAPEDDAFLRGASETLAEARTGFPDSTPTPSASGFTIRRRTRSAARMRFAGSRRGCGPTTSVAPAARRRTSGGSWRESASATRRAASSPTGATRSTSTTEGRIWSPWIHRLIAEVRRNWYIPYAASFQAGHVAIAISVLRSGDLAWLRVVVPSGVSGFENAAVGALRGAQLLAAAGRLSGAPISRSCWCFGTTSSRTTCSARPKRIADGMTPGAASARCAVRPVILIAALFGVAHVGAAQPDGGRLIRIGLADGAPAARISAPTPFSIRAGALALEATDVLVAPEPAPPASVLALGSFVGEAEAEAGGDRLDRGRGGGQRPAPGDHRALPRGSRSRT